ncbi:hypothetical protein BU24DRAFT_384424 [Aaosphaeria arxii CBS 175.79]|uniref:SET domain-containing protein n=1 Tax=Aaosphaeria arxii CBS 175.79 TaxID=1450172 RepID=A0A6A5Y8W0_9PLEO|nr:uncharacterized protein BU24DRAFT_384424 [Aaosphaeria arxii CBS 175.79]KAF2022015.1 hypothetical protein BU24DRAFT_384424 [Aaosphaeria arxii CBS 175.79]
MANRMHSQPGSRHDPIEVEDSDEYDDHPTLSSHREPYVPARVRLGNSHQLPNHHSGIGLPSLKDAILSGDKCPHQFQRPSTSQNVINLLDGDNCKVEQNLKTYNSTVKLPWRTPTKSTVQFEPLKTNQSHEVPKRGPAIDVVGGTKVPPPSYVLNQDGGTREFSVASMLNVEKLGPAGDTMHVAYHSRTDDRRDLDHHRRPLNGTHQHVLQASHQHQHPERLRNISDMGSTVSTSKPNMALHGAESIVTSTLCTSLGTTVQVDASTFTKGDPIRSNGGTGTSADRTSKAYSDLTSRPLVTNKAGDNIHELRETLEMKTRAAHKHVDALALAISQREPPVKGTPAFTGAKSRTDIENLVHKHVTELHKTHAYSIKHLLRRQRMTLARSSKMPCRSQLSDVSVRAQDGEESGQLDPFCNMKPISVAKGNVKSQQKMMTFNQLRTDGSKAADISAPVTKYRTDVPKLPTYRQHVQLQTSFLQVNNDTLSYWPLFIDDPDKRAFDRKIEKNYKCTHALHPLQHVELERCRIYTPYVNQIVESIGTSWEAILYWYLVPDESVQGIGREVNNLSGEYFRRIIEDRTGDRRIMDQGRNKTKWRKVFERLSQPSPTHLQTVAICATSFLQRTGFSLWQLVRYSPILSNHIASIVGPATQPEFSYKKNLCRVCFQYQCQYHGEVREVVDSDSDATDLEESSSSDSSSEEEGSQYSAQGSTKNLARDVAGRQGNECDIQDDTDVETVINYRRTPGLHRVKRPDADATDSEKALPKFDRKLWQKGKTHRLDVRKPFLPCDHEGRCEDALCRCFRQNVMCEKSCGCSVSCSRRYRGCKCRSLGNGRPCGVRSYCDCVQMNRECDPDLCGGCGAAEVLDPLNRDNDDILDHRCNNVSIQRNVPAKTLQGKSPVHGVGLFAGEELKRDSFIGEYIGEIISYPEMKRRNYIYKPLKMSYLFKENKSQDVDAMRAGNKLRFINHAEESKTNCYPWVKFCNTTFRIGFFAKENMKPGTELFFYYNWSDEVTEGYKQPNQEHDSESKIMAVKTKKGVPRAPTGQLQKGMLLGPPSSKARKHGSGVSLRPRSLLESQESNDLWPPMPSSDKEDGDWGAEHRGEENRYAVSSKPKRTSRRARIERDADTDDDIPLVPESRRRRWPTKRKREADDDDDDEDEE